jgi:hypothetical protein
VTATYYIQRCALVEEKHEVPKGNTKMECGEFTAVTEGGKFCRR